MLSLAPREETKRTSNKTGRASGEGWGPNRAVTVADGQRGPKGGTIGEVHQGSPL